MPMIDLVFPEGSLSTAAKEKLSSTLWETALRWEGIEATKGPASVAWVYLDERPREHISVGGRPPTQNIYRYRRQGLVDGLHRANTRLRHATGGAYEGRGG